MSSVKGFLLGLSLTFVIVASAFGGALADRFFVFKPLDSLLNRKPEESYTESGNQEDMVTSIVEESSPSVVTVSIETPRRRVLEFNPFGGFSSRFEGGSPMDIGSGFVVGEGLVVTNKHVVDTSTEYKIFLQDGSEHKVLEIVKDPANDLAILKVEGIDGHKALKLGQSDNLKVGQFVIAIGTALGEFRHTVTTGVVSGLGRGIVAGNVYEGFVERLDDVIQTDAAINLGNSGGPLLNSKGEVIGVNVAVAQGAENVGFALPVNLVSEGLVQFRESGDFASRPFLGVEHTLISEEAAILNELPQGAYVTRVVPGSSADNAGVLPEDIITKVNGESVSDAEEGLAELISKYNVGEKVNVEIWRENEFMNLEAILSENSE